MKRTVVILIFITFFSSLSTGITASELQIDFTVQSGGGYLDDNMYATASGISGNIHWICDLPSFQSGSSSSYYHMSYLVDGVYDNTHNNYWMPQSNRDSGAPPQYLKIEFPEPVYLTRIRTFNVAYIATAPELGKYRWMESYLWTSENGTDYVQMGDVAIDETPNYHDYVDISINSWVQYVEYRFYEDGENIPNYYGMGEVIIFMDDTPQEDTAVPEPATLGLLAISVSGLIRKRFIK